MLRPGQTRLGTMQFLDLFSTPGTAPDDHADQGDHAAASQVAPEILQVKNLHVVIVVYYQVFPCLTY